MTKKQLLKMIIQNLEQIRNGTTIEVAQLMYKIKDNYEIITFIREDTYTKLTEMQDKYGK